MKILKTRILFSAFLLLHFFVNAAGEKNTKELMECESFITIHGSSNINKFQFINHNLNLIPSTKTSEKHNGYQNIRIPVYDFSGPNNRILNDFYEMVSASDYPYIQISIEPREKADFDETAGTSIFKTIISLAGQSGIYKVPCEILFCNNSEYILKGNLEVELTDFNIRPPEKVLGAIKVNNEVFINFAFKLKIEETLTEKITF